MRQMAFSSPGEFPRKKTEKTGIPLGFPFPEGTYYCFRPTAGGGGGDGLCAGFDGILDCDI